MLAKLYLMIPLFRISLNISENLPKHHSEECRQIARPVMSSEGMGSPYVPRLPWCALKSPIAQHRVSDRVY